MTFESALYRLKIAQGFLEESRQDVQLQRWRSAVDNSQLAVENSAKGYFSTSIAEKIERLAECAEQLGFDVHIQTDYGDETGRRTPWDLFDEEDARQAQSLAQESVDLAETIFREVEK